MLQLTPAAATQLAQVRQAQGLPETFGLRVFGQPRPGGEMGYELTFAPFPAEDDEVTEQAGTLVFLAPEVTEVLSLASLDVEDSQNGTKFVITRQAMGEDL